jgi:hypothetical protein
MARDEMRMPVVGKGVTWWVKDDIVGTGCVATLDAKYAVEGLLVIRCEVVDERGRKAEESVEIYIER